MLWYGVGRLVVGGRYGVGTVLPRGGIGVAIG